MRFLFQICPILAFQFVALASPCSAFDIVGIMVPACRSIEIEAIALDGDAHGKGVDGSCIFIKPGERIDVRDTHDGGFQLVIDPVGGPVWLPAQVLTDNEPLSSERYSEIGNETISEFGADRDSSKWVSMLVQDEASKDKLGDWNPNVIAANTYWCMLTRPEVLGISAEALSQTKAIEVVPACIKAVVVTGHNWSPVKYSQSIDIV